MIDKLERELKYSMFHFLAKFYVCYFVVFRVLILALLLGSDLCLSYIYMPLQLQISVTNVFLQVLVRH
jgi:hypothetical protein